MVYVSNKLPPEEVRYQTEHIHENRGVGLVAFLIVALVASTVFVLARLYVRYRSRVKLEGADYTVIAALVRNGIPFSFHVTSPGWIIT